MLVDIGALAKSSFQSKLCSGNPGKCVNNTAAAGKFSLLQNTDTGYERGITALVSLIPGNEFGCMVRLFVIERLRLLSAEAVFFLMKNL
jgi:hypothetical protein